MSAPSPEAATLRCERCGGGFAFVPGARAVPCPYCGHWQAPSPGLVAELSRYRANVEGELARADQAYVRAAAWEGWADYGRRTTPGLKRLIPLMSGVTLLGALAFPASQALDIPPDVVRVVATPLLVVMPFLLMIYVVVQGARTGAGSRRAVAGHVAVSCPNCGASGHLVAGAPAQTCGYCHATLVASALVMQRGVDTAARAHRHARLEELRQERAGMASLAAHDMTEYLPYFVLGPFLFMTGGGAFAFTIEMLAGSEPYSPAIFVLWGVFFLILAAGGAWIIRRRSRREAFRGAVDDLAEQFAGQRIDALSGTVSWLDRFWPERYAGTKSYPGSYFVAASLDVSGYPALLVCDVTRGKGRTPRLELLVGAIRPAQAPALDAQAAANAALMRCRELGFTVSFSEAGLLGQADERTRALVTKTPPALHAVAPVATAMARAAHALGAEPAE